MGDLHWTTTAVLIAVALLGGALALRWGVHLSWAELARDGDLDGESQAVPDEPLHLAGVPVRDGPPPAIPTHLGAGAQRQGDRFMKDAVRYDGSLEMFCEPPKTINVAHLRFLRWLIEQGRLEHPPAGPPSGELAGVEVTWSLSEAA
jgi:hypothetical protein